LPLLLRCNFIQLTYPTKEVANHHHDPKQELEFEQEEPGTNIMFDIFGGGFNANKLKPRK
jgi:hypothetical protein